MHLQRVHIDHTGSLCSWTSISDRPRASAEPRSGQQESALEGLTWPEAETV
jgi:hypothetical protein